MDEYWRLQEKMREHRPRQRMFMLDGNSAGRSPEHNKAPPLLLYNAGGSASGHILVSTGGDRIAIS